MNVFAVETDVTLSHCAFYTAYILQIVVLPDNIPQEGNGEGKCFKEKKHEDEGYNGNNCGEKKEAVCQIDSKL